jgi:hypothetical protein
MNTNDCSDCAQLAIRVTQCGCYGVRHSGCRTCGAVRYDPLSRNTGEPPPAGRPTFPKSSTLIYVYKLSLTILSNGIAGRLCLVTRAWRMKAAVCITGGAHAGVPIGTNGCANTTRSGHIGGVGAWAAPPPCRPCEKPHTSGRSLPRHIGRRNDTGHRIGEPVRQIKPMLLHFIGDGNPGR